MIDKLFMYLVSAIFIAFSIYVGTMPGSTLERMFGSHVEAIIPWLIVFMFLLGLKLCWQRWQQLIVLQHGVKPSPMTGYVNLLKSSGIDAVIEQIHHAPASMLHGRIQAILEQWLAHPGIQDADVVLQQHVEHDRDTSHRSYALLRMLVWALPVLGLIGTVIGISLAVAGFSTFLSGGVDDVKEIKSSLVGVTSGLSFAFLITLLGLATSLILMFLTSYLENSENSLLAYIQRQITDQLLPALQSITPLGSAAGIPPELNAAMDRFRSEVETTTGILTSVTHSLTEGLQAVQKGFADIPGLLQVGMAGFRVDMRSSTDTFRAGVTTATASLTTDMATFHDGVRSFTDAFRSSVATATGGLTADVANFREGAIAATNAFRLDVTVASKGLVEDMAKLREALRASAVVFSKMIEEHTQHLTPTVQTLPAVETDNTSISALAELTPKLQNEVATIVAALGQIRQVAANSAPALDGVTAAGHVSRTTVTPLFIKISTLLIFLVGVGIGGGTMLFSAYKEAFVTVPKLADSSLTALTQTSSVHQLHSASTQAPSPQQTEKNNLNTVVVSTASPVKITPLNAPISNTSNQTIIPQSTALPLQQPRLETSLQDPNISPVSVGPAISSLTPAFIPPAQPSPTAPSSVTPVPKPTDTEQSTNDALNHIQLLIKEANMLPPGREALELYTQVLAIDAKNALARNGIVKIAESAEQQAKRHSGRQGRMWINLHKECLKLLGSPH